jgi:pyridoxamine 5'-phosphate oxidase
MPKANLTLNKDPVVQFRSWFRDAIQTGMKYPDAMTLATASAKGAPSARTVLYKGMNKEGLKFFTNYNSRKSKELQANPRAAVLFYWPQLNRQIRIEGRIKKLSSQESDEYWLTRPSESRINAAASPQSSRISGRAILLKKVKELLQKYGDTIIPRPTHWGGYCLIPNKFEFWIEGKYRLHDRFQYRKQKGKWQQVRLAP